MGLTEQTVIDKIEILADGQIQVRRADKILKDGNEIAKVYHRHVLTPGDNLEGQDARVQAVARAVWTPDVLSAWKELRAKQEVAA